MRSRRISISCGLLFEQQGLNNTEIQSISSGALSTGTSNEVLIFVEQAGQSDQAMDESKAKVLSALDATYGVAGSSKPDFNSTTPSALANFLSQKDPLGLSVAAGEISNAGEEPFGVSRQRQERRNQ